MGEALERLCQVGEREPGTVYWAALVLLKCLEQAGEDGQVVYKELRLDCKFEWSRRGLELE